MVGGLRKKGCVYHGPKGVIGYPGDAAVWKSVANNYNPDSPSRRHLRKGLLKKDVVGLLGPADLKSGNDF
jgi:hypothetical protein